MRGLMSVSARSSSMENLRSKDRESEAFELLKQGVKSGSLSTVTNALKNEADPNGMIEEPGPSQWDPVRSLKKNFIKDRNILHLACERGDREIVHELLEYGADVNAATKIWKKTPIHIACAAGHASVVEELILYDANKSVLSGDCGMTPLEVAVLFQRVDCCQILLEADADPDSLNGMYGSTPLTHACSQGNYKLAELLLAYDANPNLSVRTTPLYRAVPFPEILELLLSKEAKVDCTNAWDAPEHAAGAQALHQAAYLGSEEAVRILLEAGADPKALNSLQETPLDLAKTHLQYRQEELKTYLQMQGQHQKISLREMETARSMVEKLQKVVALLDS